jgi:regulatory protein
MADRDPLDIAARALRHRDRSRQEIADRLARAGVEEEDRADALDTLVRVGYVDDARFALARAEALATRNLGDEAIRHDLGGHGVAGEAVEAAIASLAPEAVRARAVAGRLGLSAKTAAALARKGFSPDSLESAFGSEIAAPGDFDG